jgi:hypothetical protein
VTAGARRFRPPWRVEEHKESFIVRDANGQPSVISTLTMNRSADRQQIGSPGTKRGGWQ